MAQQPRAESPLPHCKPLGPDVFPPHPRQHLGWCSWDERVDSNDIEINDIDHDSNDIDTNDVNINDIDNDINDI